MQRVGSIKMNHLADTFRMLHDADVAVMTCWEPVTVIPQYCCEEDKTEDKTTWGVAQQCQCVHVKTGNHIFSSVLPCRLIFFTDRFWLLPPLFNARTTPCSVYALYRKARANIEYWVYKLDLNAPWMPHPLSNSNLLSLESRPWMLSQTLFTYFLSESLLLI